jgi:hypothetical protein
MTTAGAEGCASTFRNSRSNERVFSVLFNVTSISLPSLATNSRNTCGSGPGEGAVGLGSGRRQVAGVRAPRAAAVL